jgi:hypothetical protein
MIDDGDCGATGGIKIGRGNRSTRRKPAPAPLCPPQIPHTVLIRTKNRLRTWRKFIHRGRHNMKRKFRVLANKRIETSKVI